jgi:hypothetical protein
MTTCEPIFEIPLVTYGTAVLLFSSFFVVMALNRAGQAGRLLTWLSRGDHPVRMESTIQPSLTRGWYTTNLFSVASHPPGSRTTSPSG